MDRKCGTIDGVLSYIFKKTSKRRYLLIVSFFYTPYKMGNGYKGYNKMEVEKIVCETIEVM